MVNKKSQSSLLDCLISQSPDLICICDELGLIININNRFAEITGKEVEELKGTLIKTIFDQNNQKLNDLLYARVKTAITEDCFNNTIVDESNSLKCISWVISSYQNLRIIRGTASKSYLNDDSTKTNQQLKAVINHASDCFFILDQHLDILFQNDAATKKFAHPKFGNDSHVFFASFPEETNKKFYDHFKYALATRKNIKFVEFSTILNCWFTIDVLPYGNELNILVEDISDTIVDHKINDIELKTFELNRAKNTPVNEVFAFLLKSFESLFPHFHCSVLKVEHQKIWHIASPSIPLDYSWAIDGLEIGINRGSCGTAAHLKKSIITDDIYTDEKWSEFKHLIAKYGYKSCWSFPIVSAKSMEVMATFALYTKENLTPTENESKAIARLCNIIKIIFEDLKQDDLLMLMNNRYEMVTMATNDAIYDWDLKTNNVYWSENLYNIFGFTPLEAHQSKKWWLNHIHKNDRIKTVTALNKCLRKKETGWMVEYRLQCKNGKYKHVYNRGYIIYDSQNLPVSIIGAVQDITGLKEREIEITLQNKKLKEIAQISSHDLRRPVTSILGLVSLFNLKNIADENNGIIINYLQKATEELDQVIHSIVAKTLAADESIYHKIQNFNTNNDTPPSELS
ncbi:MAG TPA: PAS domain-containing protein [Pelobium sp.]